MGRKRSYSGYAGPPKRARYAGFAGKVAGVNASSRIGRALRRSASSIRSMVVPGYTRSAGVYGRFSRSSGATELKFFDTQIDTPIDTTGENIANLCTITQGDGPSSRDGRKAVIKSIQIRGYMYFVPAATATASALVNMWLVLDTQTNGVAATANSDLFTSNAFATAMLNLDNSGRFRILKHWNLAFNSNAGATTAFNNVVKPIEYYQTCNIPIDWSSSTGDISEIRSNNLFLCAGGTLQDDKVTFTATVRLRFVG